MSSRDDLHHIISGEEQEHDAAVHRGANGEDHGAGGHRYGTFGHKRSSSVGGSPRGGGDPEAGGLLSPTSSSSGSPSSSLARSPPPSRAAKTRQTLSALGYCLGAFAMGNALGWSSPALPRLESPESSPQLSPSEAGWVGSLVCLGALLQGPSTGFVMTRMGRRWAVVLECVPCLAGWLFIANASDAWMLYSGRLLTGWAAGAFSVVAPIYVGEIAAPEIRGALGTLFQLAVVSGILIMYVAGTSVSWQNLALLGACAPCALAAVGLFLLRDSPASYMSRGRPELARKCLVWLRNSADIDEELYACQRAASAARASSLRVTNVLCSNDPAIRRPVLLAVFLMCAQQVTKGADSFLNYPVMIIISPALWSERRDRVHRGHLPRGRGYFHRPLRRHSHSWVGPIRRHSPQLLR